MNATISIERMLAVYGSLGQAASGSQIDADCGAVKALTSTEIFRTNLARLMAEQDVSQARLSRESGVGQRSIGRILVNQQNPSLDICDAIAKVFKLSTWQMLQPNLDPRSPPVLPSERELEMFSRWHTLMQELATYNRKPGK